MDHLNEIRKKSKEKRSRLEIENALLGKNQRLMDTIDDLLSYDTCFANLPIEIGMPLLIYLGFSKERAKEIYPGLVQESVDHMKGKYILVDPEIL